MASVPSTLRIVEATDLGPSTRVLEIQRADGAPFVAIGGKYIIVNTGVVPPEGKVAKRAYSLMPAPGAGGAAPMRCRLAVKRLGEGPGSNALHAAPLGTEMLFSGPWGKLVPEGGLVDRTLFVATDTGITSALGVVEQARASGGDAAGIEVLWLRTEDETFLDVDHVRSRVLASGARFVHAVIPPVNAPGRTADAWKHVTARVAEHAPSVLLGAGDGAIVFPLRALFAADGASGACAADSGTGVREVRIECFFNNPERKSV
jgi:NAD(P)H-flavin reductase